MRNKKILAQLLTGLLVLEAAFSPVMKANAEGAEEVTAEAAEEEAEDAAAEVPEEDTVQLAEEAAEEVTEGSALSTLMYNLEKYMPEDADDDAPTPDQAAMPVTGIDPVMPAEGDVNTLVVLAEFQDCHFAEGFKEQLKAQVFKEDTAESKEDPLYPYESLTAYYQRSSFDNLRIKGEFLEFSSEHERSWYPASENDDNAYLYQEVLDYWAAKIISGKPEDSVLSDRNYLNEYLSKYDADGDMRLDACYIVAAGGNNGWSGQWWAYRTSDSDHTIGSYTLPSVIQVVDTEHETAGLDNMADYLVTFIHETGHQLGLDDYYSYESYLEKLDTFAMMGTNGGDQDGFAKMLLGWLPEESVHWVTEGENVELRPYSTSGDVAIILPREEKEKYGIYSQFILAEYYKAEGNDIVDEYNRKRRDPETGEIYLLEQPQDALRLYHVYARLNESRTGFIVTNMYDEMIPLISNYWCGTDTDYGFYHDGDSLTPASSPSSEYYLDRAGTGLLKDCEMVNSGISVDGIHIGTDGKLGFRAEISEDAVNRPQVISAAHSGFYDGEAGYVNAIELVFDQPVNIDKNMKAAVYDRDPQSGLPIYDETWARIVDIRRSPGYSYSSKNDTFYFIVEDEHFTDGVLVLPRGMISSTAGVAADELVIPFSLYSDEFPFVDLGVSVPAGAYAEAFDMTFTGIPEGTVIFYELDGNEPSPDSSVYDGSIRIEGDTILKAIAVGEDGYPRSRRLEVNYYIENVIPEKTELTLSVGESFALGAAFVGDPQADPSISFESSDPACVFVRKDGTLFGRQEGKAKITLRTVHGIEAVCNVSVSDASVKALEAALKEKYGDESAAVLEELENALNGQMTLTEFYEGGYLEKRWVAAIDETVYTGKAVKPAVSVYDGAKRLTEKKEYKLSYKNNKNAGTASVTVSFKGAYKKEAAQTMEFVIRPVRLYQDLFGEMSVKYTGKLQKPKPLLYRRDNGEKVKFTAADADIYYLDENFEAIDGFRDEGVYYIGLVGKDKNYTGDVMLPVSVRKIDQIEKLKVKKKTKSFKYTGAEICPEYGKDFTITAPKGYSGFTDENGDLLPSEVGVMYVNNVAPGKMAVVIYGPGSGNYYGLQVIYFKIKK